MRGAHRIFSESDTAFLVSLGATANELYDYVEDWCEAGEPSWETVLAIAAVRYEYVMSEQRGRGFTPVSGAGAIPSGWSSLGGVRWLPRIIAKARAKLRGELPPGLMYACGADRPFLRGVGLHPAEFLRLVWEAGDNDQKILERVQQESQRVRKP